MIAPVVFTAAASSVLSKLYPLRRFRGLQSQVGWDDPRQFCGRKLAEVIYEVCGNDFDLDPNPENVDGQTRSLVARLPFTCCRHYIIICTIRILKQTFCNGRAPWRKTVYHNQRICNLRHPCKMDVTSLILSLYSRLYINIIYLSQIHIQFHYNYYLKNFNLSRIMKQYN